MLFRRLEKFLCNLPHNTQLLLATLLAFVLACTIIVGLGKMIDIYAALTLGATVAVIAVSGLIAIELRHIFVVRQAAIEAAEAARRQAVMDQFMERNAGNLRPAEKRGTTAKLLSVPRAIQMEIDRQAANREAREARTELAFAYARVKVRDILAPTAEG